MLANNTVSAFKLSSLRQRRLPDSPMKVNASQPQDEDLESLICQGDFGAWFTIVGLIFIFFIMLTCLFGNSLVCVAGIKFSYLQSYSENFILSLALSDIMVAVTVLPFDAVYWIAFPRWPLGGIACNLWNSLFFLFLTASVLNLMSISIDRFLAVVYPLRYNAWMTPTLNKFMIASVWVYSFIIAVLIFFLLEQPEEGVYGFDLHPVFHGFLIIGNVIFPFCVMIGLYYKIYRIAKGHSRRTLLVMSSTVDSSSSAGRVNGRKFARELRLAKTLGIVVLCFVICWLPFEIINIMILVDEGVANCNVEIADTVTCWFAYMQCSLNPVLYALSSPEYRRAFKKLLLIRMQGSADVEPVGLNSQSNTAENVAKSASYRSDQSATVTDN